MPGASQAPSRSVAAASGKLRWTGMDHAALAKRIKAWGAELGFQAVGIADADLSAAEPRLLEWLAQGLHGGVGDMGPPGWVRRRAPGVRPGALRVISRPPDYVEDG